MSRIGRKPVAIPSGVTVQVAGNSIKVEGPKGKLSIPMLPEVNVAVEGNQVLITTKTDNLQSRERHGLIRQLIANMVFGVEKGFQKKLEIIGVGYKAQVKGKTLVLNLGHSHPINFPVPEGIEVAPDAENKNVLVISGVDKQLVGQTAAVIRGYRPPEPYKGKGVRYTDEFVRRKAGKAAAAKTAA